VRPNEPERLKENRIMRSSWTSALVILLAGVGLAAGQLPAPLDCQCDDGERYITVSEDNGQPEKCKIIGCWQENGSRFCQVQSLSTGELMTLLNPPQIAGAPEFIGNPAGSPATNPGMGEPVTAASTTVFRWGNQTTPPEGFPVPPPEVCQCETGTGLVPHSPHLTTKAPPLLTQTPKYNPGYTPITTPPLAHKGQTKGSSPYSPLQMDSGNGTNTKSLAAIATQTPNTEPKPQSQPTGPLTRLKDFFSKGKDEDPSNHQGGDPVRTKPLTSVPQPSALVQSTMPEPQPVYKQMQTTQSPKQVPDKEPTIKEKPESASPSTVVSTKENKQEIPPPVPFPGNTKTQETSPGTPFQLPPVSQTVEGKKTDPLSSPLSFTTPDVEKKVPGIQPPRNDTTAGKVPMPFGVSSQTQQHPGANPPAAPIDPRGAPLGSQSVMAANNGLNYPMKYIPYPVVTVPQPNHPPGPPPPQIPQAPDPAAFVNAFTAPNQVQQMQNGQMPNYQGYPQPMMANPYGYPGMNPHAMMAMRPPMPYNGGQPMAMPYPAPQMPMAAPTPQNPMNMSRTYSGPMPPNPMANMPIAQIAFNQNYAAPAFNQLPYTNPAMDRPGLPVRQPAALTQQDAMYQMLGTLKTSLYPAHREWAVIQLSNMDWRRHPQILQGLLTGAKEDPAAKVRVSCVQALTRMQVNRALMASTLESLRSDVDPRVRQAAEEALGMAGNASVGNSASALPVAPQTKY
jgi:hypothetical protein